MNETKTFNFKLPVIILAWVAVGLSSLSCINTLVKYEPGFLGFFSLLLTLAPFVLLALYATIFHSNEKLAIFIPIIFALFAYQPLHILFTNIVEYDYEISFEYLFSFTYNNAPIVALSVFSALGALKGMKDKKFILPLLALLLIPEWDAFGSLLNSLDDSSSSYFFTFCSIVGAASGYVSLLLFALNNEIPAVIGASSEPTFTPEPAFTPEPIFTPEPEAAPEPEVAPEPEAASEGDLVHASAVAMLDELNKQFSNGQISQEEYLKARTQIINSL